MGFFRGDSDQLSQKNCQIELLDKIYVFGGIKMDAAAKQKKEKIQTEDAGSIYDSVFLNSNLSNAHMVRSSRQLF